MRTNKRVVANRASEPLFELLIDRHHLDVLVLLHFIPRGGIGLGPNDYTAKVRKIRGELRGWWVMLTMRATREAGEVPRTADYSGTYNDVAAGQCDVSINGLSIR